MAQVDENLNEQLKFTSDYLKNLVQEWNKQNQALFDKQLGNLHAKILQVKSDNIINNERVLAAVGVNHPSLSSKTSIFALNKVIEMILQFLVTNSLIKNDQNQQAVNNQVSGTFQPLQKVQKKLSKDLDKSTQIEMHSYDGKSSMGNDTQLDLEPGMQVTENTVSK